MRDLRDLPWAAKVYTLGIGVAAAGAVLAIAGGDFPGLQYRGFAVSRDQVFFLLLAFMAAQIPYRLPGLRVRFYVSFGIDLATLLAVGPEAAMVNAFLGRLTGVAVAEGSAEHLPWYQMLTRTGEGVLALLPAAVVLERLSPLGRLTYTWWVPYIGTGLCFAFANTALKALGAALRYRVSLRRLWFRDLAADSSHAVVQVLLGVILGGFFRTHPVTLTGMWLDIIFVSLVIYSSRLHAGIARLHWSTMHAIIGAMDLREPRKAGHSERVARLAVAIGRKLYLSDRRLIRLYSAALLHDIGWVAVDEEQLLAPLPRKAVPRLVAEHLEHGTEAIARMGLEPELVDFVRYHHQWFNGHGVPGGRRGQQLPLEARILAVANAYDNLVTARAYRLAISRKAAGQRLLRGAYTQFDPDLIKILNNLLREEERWGTPVFIRCYWLDTVGAAPRW